MQVIRKIDNAMNNVYLYISVVLLAVVIVATGVQVFTRYIMNASLSGTDEVARFAFVWMSMMGASLCVRQYGHAVVSILNDSLKKHFKAQKMHDIIIQLLMLVAALFLLVYGIELVISTHGQTSAGLGIPMSFTYACIPFGAFGMVINGIVNILDNIAGIVKGSEIDE